MILIETSVVGAHLVEAEKREDERGFFARAFCEREFRDAGLVGAFVQVNDSYSAHKGTLRGMHYQVAPDEETKLVRCVRGALYDVVLDLRTDSPTFGQSYGAKLSAENRRMMYCPRGCAHGFVTLSDDVEALYFVDSFYSPESERGVRWDDPAFDIDWPIIPQVMSDKDRSHPDFNVGDSDGGNAG